MQKMIKRTAMLTVLMGMLQFGGCGGIFNVERILSSFVTSAAYDFVADNDGIFDLFESGATATNP